MPGRIMRCGAIWGAIVMLLLSLTSCRNSALDEANKLIQSGSEDIKAIDKIVRDNKDKEREVSNAIDRNETAKAIAILDDALKVIDEGLRKAESAAAKFDSASRLDVDPTIKEYLSLRAKAVNKASEGFREIRRGVTALRESLSGNDKASGDKAKADFRGTSARVQQLASEAQQFEGQAAELARRNPDKIKPGL